MGHFRSPCYGAKNRIERQNENASVKIAHPSGYRRHIACQGRSTSKRATQGASDASLNCGGKFNELEAELHAHGVAISASAHDDRSARETSPYR